MNRFLECTRERESGFTLIELLVVVIMIGILLAIAIPVYLGVEKGIVHHAKPQTCVINISTNACSR